jgi:hypothetical protein
MAEEALQGAAVKYLLSIPEVVAAVGKSVDTEKPFIFQDEMLANLEESHYSTVSAIVVEDGGPLAISALSRFRARRLAVHIWANGTRDAYGNLLSGKVVEDKIDATFKIVDRFMQRTNPSTVLWATTYTYGCDRIGDLSKAVSVIDGDGIKTATVYYSVLI